MNKPSVVCPEPGCRKLNCTQHPAHKRADMYRGTPAARGYEGENIEAQKCFGRKNK